MAGTDPEPFRIEVSDDRLTELTNRLRATRFAPDHHNEDWWYGVPTEVLRRWVADWAAFDWRTAEAAMNRLSHNRVTIDGVPLHYVRRPGVGPAPVPLVLIHGWPWTFWDWHATIDPLADPGSHGGDPRDAFDVVVVSLPGFTFSNPLATAGIGYTQAADLVVALMGDVLGFDRFAAAGGDMGSLTSAQLGHKYADRMIGIHLFGIVPLNIWSRPDPLPPPPEFGFARPTQPITDPVIGAMPRPRRMASAHLFAQGLEPQTLSAAMHDSPAGMLAWLLHRRYWWSDNSGDVLEAFDRDFLLTTFSLYWLTDCFASSVRTYREMIFRPWAPSHDRTPVVEAPTAITFFDRDELTGQSRFWAPEYFNLVRATSEPSGGHFAPAENAEAVVRELRTTFRELR